MTEYTEKWDNRQGAEKLNERLARFIRPLLEELDKQIDKRLVRTFYKALQVIVQFRHRHNRLLLS